MDAELAKRLFDLVTTTPGTAVVLFIILAPYLVGTALYVDMRRDRNQWASKYVRITDKFRVDYANFLARFEARAGANGATRRYRSSTTDDADPRD